MDKRYLTAREAAEELGITTATLYAYVSRGLVRSEPGSEKKRDRRYRAEDIAALKERRELRRDPAGATAKALHWGTPLLESAITLIQDGRLYYRGHDAVELAANRRIEEVAGLIWNDAHGVPPSLGNSSVRPVPRLRRLRRELVGLPSIELFQALLPVAGAEDLAALDLRSDAVRQAGARILRLLVATAAGTEKVENGIARTLAAGWRTGGTHGPRMLDMAMILAADHELNVSSFTVRCVASAGATPYAAVGAGLGAIGGVKHGRYTERVEALFDETGKPERAREAVAARLRRGESLPGFRHELYPAGDPRGTALMNAVAGMAPRSPAVRLAASIRDAAAELTGDHPTIDFGLVTLTRALGLPDGTALTLFALGRTVGWIGQAIEQYEQDRIIRPRAHYTGAMPGEREAGKG